MKLWVRDSIVSKTDFGSNDGVFSIDLLWKARSGQTHGEDAPPALLSKLFPPGATRASGAIDLQSDMRAPVDTGLPTPSIDILGASVLRTRLNYGLIFSPVFPTLPTTTDWESVANAGWFEGLIVAPFGHSAGLLSNDAGVNGQPAGAYHAVALDWMWWARKYNYANSYKIRGTGGVNGLLDSQIVYSEIDTRNGRRFTEMGTSLYWHITPSAATTSPPVQGMTVNGLVANWSILLDVPD